MLILPPTAARSMARMLVGLDVFHVETARVEGETWYYHEPCRAWFPYFEEGHHHAAARFSWLSHRCPGLTPEIVRARAERWGASLSGHMSELSD
jgi:hypothetical protein